MMELDTYRYYGHSMSDPGKRYICMYTGVMHSSKCIVLCSYRDAAEVKAVRQERDPISIFTDYAFEGNLVTNDELKVSPLHKPVIHRRYTCTFCHGLCIMATFAALLSNVLHWLHFGGGNACMHA